MKSDVWSFGILLHETVTYGELPYPDMKKVQVVESVPHGYRMPQPDNCPEVLYGVMLDCWNENADLRPSFKTLQCNLKGIHELHGAESAHE